MAKALDMAVSLDYWGREPGEMVMRLKGKEGEMMPLNQRTFHDSGSRETIRVGVGRYRAADQAWSYSGDPFRIFHFSV